ncbi:MAG: hypothetical protein V9F03_11465 [Microthrixaceae bacterium]
MMPSSETSPMKVPYRLPVTVVRFAGNRRTVKDALTKPDPESTVVSSVLVDVRADPRQDLILHVPADGQGDLKVDLGLLDDGRLVSTSTAWDARGDERTKAIMSLATTGLAAGAALGGPAGALGGFVIGGALAAVATSTGGEVTDPVGGFHGDLGVRTLAPDDVAISAPMQKTADDESSMSTRTRINVGALSSKDLGVRSEYSKEHPNEAHLLVGYRRAEVSLLQRLSEWALDETAEPESQAEAMRSLERSLATARRVAQRSEALYAAWRSEHRIEQVEPLAAELFIDQIPTTDEFHKVIGLPPAQRTVKWWEVARDHRMMVTCDRQLTTTGVPWESTLEPERAVARAASVRFRRPVAAKLTTWRVVKDSNGHYEASPIEYRWVLVTHPDHSGTMTLPSLLRSDATVDVTFSPIGAITGIGSSASGAVADRAAAFSELPSVIDSSAKVGTSIGKLVSPSSALAAQVADLENRRKLGLVTLDASEQLEREVEVAELRARLIAAQQKLTDPSGASVVSS